MRKALTIILIVIIAAGLLSGCKAKEETIFDITPASPAPEQLSPALQPAEEGYSVKNEDILLPEDAPEGGARYRLRYSIPVFPSDTLNAAVEDYLDELYTRVTTERMPLADGTDPLPYTSVEFSVQYAELPDGQYTNIIFSETAGYGEGAENEEELYTIVADSTGTARSIAYVSGVYSPDDMVAQQIWNILSTEPERYYGDVSIESILPALDLYNGFTVADEGYTVFIPAGAIGDTAYEFSFALSALYPGFVGEVLSVDQYLSLMPAMNAAAAAFGPDYSGFDGAPTGQSAAIFLREYFLNGSTEAVIAEADYLSAYKRLFGGESAPESAPGVEYDPSAGTIKLAGTSAVYRYQAEDAYSEGNVVTITGNLMSGIPGSGDSAIAAPARVTIELNESGYIITGFEVM